MAVARIYRMSCAPGKHEELRGALEALAGALADKPRGGSFEYVFET